MSMDSEMPRPLSVGDPFPDFELQDENGETLRFSDIKGKRAIIFFYPKDNTAGCTREAKEFSNARLVLEDNGILLFGVSKDSVKSHRKFIDKQGLDVRLLSDPDHTLMEQVGAWGPKISYGRMTTGAIRTTFIISEGGLVENVWRNVRVPGHVETVVKYLLW